VDRLATFLDKYPQAYVDLAARMGQIQYQTRQDNKKVRQFFIQYADRILYATDLTQSPIQSDSKATIAQAINVWKADWLFLTSNKMQKSAAVAGEFKGLKLPQDVINKIYYQNALKAFPSGFAALRTKIQREGGK
jgi:predicted TIM-barrel fold metal-dependent hydrolase